MKNLITLGIFLLICSSGYAQNYYVASFNGNIYYNGKLIQKRDKIPVKGELKFTSENDFVKLSGPGGLYTLTPNSDPDSGSEFLIALRNELFPQLRLHPTTANDMIAYRNTYFFNYPGCQYSFFERTILDRKIPYLKEGEELGFIHKTASGLIYKTAETKDSLLVINKSDFTVQQTTGEVLNIDSTFIVHVFDKAAFLQILSKSSSLDALRTEFDIVNSHYQLPLDENGNPIVIEYPAMILDLMGPTRFINKKAILKDLKFHIKRSVPTSIEMFLEEYEYESYIYNTYGNIYEQVMDTIWDELGLKSSYDQE
ncbi:MAG: hypothetical protein KDC34_18700 [Saprospiraceae bacterium]|nr:hypothetical protein [Saprospiraceae bacterium]